MVKDRLLDLLSREDEEESHGENVVRAASDPSLQSAVWKWSVQIRCNFTRSDHAYQTMPYPYPSTDCVHTDSSMLVWGEKKL